MNEPASKIMVAELDLTERTFNNYGSPWWGNAAARWGFGFAGHNGQINVLFCDGPAKGMNPTQIISGTTSPQQFNMWGGFDQGYNPPGCGTRDINCDGGSDFVVQHLQLCENNYN